MNIICIIPARGDSKEIIGKNIIDFCGKPLIAWTIQQALGSHYIKDVYVSSDNSEILTISEQYGSKLIERPKDIARDESTSEEALIHAITQIEKNTDKTQDRLEEIIPSKWKMKAHHFLILHGRKICKSQKPKCEICKISYFCDYLSKSF